MSIIAGSTIKQASLLLLISAIIGFVVNIFHPNSVEISTERPPLVYAADTTFTHELEDVSISGGEQPNEPSIPLINLKQLRQLIAAKSAILLDARSPEAFQFETLPNAINLPIEDLFDYEQTIKKLPHDKWLVCFCADVMWDLAEFLSNELINREFKHVVYLKGGVKEWKQAGNITIPGGKHE